MIAGVLLAAGGATRFGSQKLLATIDDAAVVRRAAATLASVVDHAIAVVGADADAVAAAIRGVSIEIVRNARWRDGLSSSLRAGLDALPAGTTAALIALGDQPFVSRESALAVIGQWRKTGLPIVVPVYDGVRGHPVLLARELFAELARIEGDIGAREVIARDSARVSLVKLPGPAPADVDTPRDLSRLRES